MPLFDIPTRTSKNNDLVIAKKSNTVSKSVTTIRSDILSLIESAKREVEEHLGKYKNYYYAIRDIVELDRYINSCIESGIASIDTETTGKNPMVDKLVGFSLYTPNEPKACYVPVNHLSYVTNERVSGQLTEQELKPYLDKLKDTKLVMFNAQFDMRIIKNNVGSDLKCWWDASLASRLLNENEDEKRGFRKLKKLHAKYVLRNEESGASFGDLFDNPEVFRKFPIDLATIYGGHDAKITFEYYEFQSRYLDVNNPRQDLANVAKAFLYREMPVVEVVADMENTGVAFDKELAQQLSIQYHKELEEKLLLVNNEVSKYIDSTNFNVNSTTQLAHLLYDIIKVGVIDKDNPRGTGEDILKQINLPLCTYILEYRELKKLLSTYIDKLPKCVDEKTQRLHCRFNQYGADTGRFSSNDPNLQNIPANDTRKLFKATDGYVMMSSDYSQQEPKCLAALCRMAGDSQMYDVFMAGKDLYSDIASVSSEGKYSYDECREFNPDGTTNKEGKHRRKEAKSILLGVLYGRGDESVAEQLGCTLENAKAIKERVFKGYPAIKKFEDDSMKMAKTLGYVTTIVGRKRRLPDIQLPQYEFQSDKEIPQARKDYYLSKLSKCWGKQKRSIFEEANKEGIWIVDNGKKIGDATRQVVNSRIQGSAADLTKAAMVALYHNERAKEIGMRILIPIHDELLVECKEEYAKEGKELLASIMSKAAEEILQMPIKCDVSVTKRWYGEEIEL